LHPDTAALAALPFSSLVVDVPFEFFQRNLAGVAGHDNTLVSRIAVPRRLTGTRLVGADLGRFVEYLFEAKLEAASGSDLCRQAGVPNQC
jgi:hypothetical protein